MGDRLPEDPGVLKKTNRVKINCGPRLLRVGPTLHLDPRVVVCFVILGLAGFSQVGQAAARGHTIALLANAQEKGRPSS